MIDPDKKHLTMRGVAYYGAQEMDTERLIARIAEVVEENLEPPVDPYSLMQAKEIVLGLTDALAEKELK